MRWKAHEREITAGPRILAQIRTVAPCNPSGRKRKKLRERQCQSIKNLEWWPFHGKTPHPFDGLRRFLS